MALTKRLRYEILRRDNHACRYCGATAPDVALTVDHVLPVALGGTDEPCNLVAACKDCNAGKAASTPDAPLVAQVADDAIRWAAAIAQAATVLQAARDDELAYVDKIDSSWELYDYGFNNKWTHPRPSDWATSVERLRARGLPLDVAVDCVDIAMRSTHVKPDRMWAYYMGVCWKRLEEHTKVAREILDASTIESGAAVTIPRPGDGR